MALWSVPAPQVSLPAPTNAPVPPVVKTFGAEANQMSEVFERVRKRVANKESYPSTHCRMQVRAREMSWSKKQRAFWSLPDVRLGSFLDSPTNSTPPWHLLTTPCQAALLPELSALDPARVVDNHRKVVLKLFRLSLHGAQGVVQPVLPFTLAASWCSPPIVECSATLGYIVERFRRRCTQRKRASPCRYTGVRR